MTRSGPEQLQHAGHAVERFAEKADMSGTPLGFDRAMVALSAMCLEADDGRPSRWATSGRSLTWLSVGDLRINRQAVILDLCGSMGGFTLETGLRWYGKLAQFRRA